MTAEILGIETPVKFAAAVERAVEILRAGQLAALPTETVYGLAASALNEDAVKRIYEAKGRPAENPIIVHVANIEMARRCVSQWTTDAERLVEAFWPGPLTLVLPRSEEIPPLVTAGGSTVGVRWPRHPFMQAVIEACGFPLAAPSANRSNEVSPTTAEHVRKSLGAHIPLIIDGGPSQVGIESTVLDLAGTRPRLLRPGMISVEALEAILGRGTVDTSHAPTSIARSPGQLPRHYSPRAKLLVLHWRDDEDLAAQISTLGASHEKIHLITHRSDPSREKFARLAVVPADAQAYARVLYAELHRCDEAGAEIIIVEAPPSGEEWRGIADRLRRASHGKS